MFGYHRDYISQCRGMYKKEKCLPARTQGQKFLRSVVMVGVLDEKVLKGKRHTTLRFHNKFLDFRTYWNEEEVQEVIEAALENVLDMRAPGPRYMCLVM